MLPTDPRDDKPGQWKIHDRTYYDDTTCVSHSMLEVFRRSPPEYAQRFIHKTMTYKASKAQNIGTCLHAAVLQPEVWQKEKVVVKRRKQGDSELTVTEKEHDLVEAMAVALRQQPVMQRFLAADRVIEQPIRWLQDGLWCKGKMDLVLASEIGDIKTAADPRPEKFKRDAKAYGYARQAAYYLDGCRLAYKRPFGSFTFFVVGKKPPHEIFVYVARDPSDALTISRGENLDDLANLKKRLLDNDWALPESYPFIL